LIRLRRYSDLVPEQADFFLIALEFEYEFRNSEMSPPLAIDSF
jgi:hypothetical protein